MATSEFRLPDPGEGLVEAEIVTWRVAVGDVVKVNDILVEIETAKSLVELPSPYAGVVGELLVSEGDTVAEGDTIVVIEAMKMEQPLKAHKAGTVTGLAVEVGGTVTNGEVVCEVAG